MPAPTVIREDQWLLAQREFIECKAELKDLVIKYGVKLNTIRARARIHGWGKDRAEYRRKVIEAPPAQVAEVMAFSERPIVVNGHSTEYYQAANETYLGEIEQLTGMIRQAREAYAVAFDDQSAAICASTYDRLLERKRILMGIPLPAPIRQREKQSKGSTVIPVESSPPEPEKS